ncbi:MAG TPA: serine--tRNA ligase [Ktedonobacterales bacterium]
MLSDRLLREHPERVRDGLRRRHAGAEAEATLDGWLALDAERRELATRRDDLARTAHSAAYSGEGGREPAELVDIARTLTDLTARMRELALRLPNIPDARVPEGANASSNVELRRWGEPRTFSFPARSHDELGTALGVLDLPRATKLAGPRFPLLVGNGARLSRSLAALMLDLARERGYTEVAPPHLLRAATLEGTGHLPRFADELYALRADDLYLSPTAEAQLVALHASETFPPTALPLAYAAWTPCFRREAGSAGTARRGLLRQHQFDKVELVRIVAPEEADAAFAQMIGDAEAVLRALELPYRVVELCAGELPASAARGVDLEVWMAAQGLYVEISSISDCATFQSRRLELRYRPASGGRARYPHTLNGSALAVGRTIAALLEHNQRADGSVTLPAALRPYLSETELRPD